MVFHIRILTTSVAACAGAGIHDGRRVAAPVGQPHGLSHYQHSLETLPGSPGLRQGSQEGHGPEEIFPGGRLHILERRRAYGSHWPQSKTSTILPFSGVVNVPICSTLDLLKFLCESWGITDSNLVCCLPDKGNSNPDAASYSANHFDGL